MENVDTKTYTVLLLFFVADQVTKLASYFWSWDLGFVQSTYIENTGAGFGILQGQIWLLLIITAVFLSGIHYYRSELNQWSYALLMSGAAGNAIDRLLRGYVVDFIDFGFWPVFNVADVCLSIGVLLVVLAEFRSR